MTSDYAELMAQVRGLGLLRRRRGAYAVRSAALGAALLLTLAAVLWLGDSWYQLVVAAVLGVVLSQYGFLAHDAAHRQIFETNRANEWNARLMSTLVIGLSYGWWVKKHNAHHRSPNQIGRDPDIAPGGLVFTAEEARSRSPLVRWIRRHQGYLFFPMLLLEGLNLHAAGVRTLVQRPDLSHRALEGGLIALRFVAYLALVFLVMPPGLAVAFLGVQMATFGLLLGAAFAPNHKGMPVVPRDAKPDFLRRQVLTSRNLVSNRLLDYLYGGLNYQIEHHLFPTMPSINLRRSRPIVMAFCAAHDLPYVEVSAAESYREVSHYLGEISDAAQELQPVGG